LLFWEEKRRLAGKHVSPYFVEGLGTDTYVRTNFFLHLMHILNQTKSDSKMNFWDKIMLRQHLWRKKGSNLRTKVLSHKQSFFSNKSLES
jgi:hypothetical protein